MCITIMETEMNVLFHFKNQNQCAKVQGICQPYIKIYNVLTLS